METREGILHLESTMTSGISCLELSSQPTPSSRQDLREHPPAPARCLHGSALASKSLPALKNPAPRGSSVLAPDGAVFPHAAGDTPRSSYGEATRASRSKVPRGVLRPHILGSASSHLEEGIRQYPASPPPTPALDCQDTKSRAFLVVKTAMVVDKSPPEAIAEDTRSRRSCQPITGPLASACMPLQIHHFARGL